MGFRIPKNKPGAEMFKAPPRPRTKQNRRVKSNFEYDVTELPGRPPRTTTNWEDLEKQRKRFEEEKKPRIKINTTLILWVILWAILITLTTII